MGSVSYNREGKAKCLFTNLLNGAHEWVWNTKKKYYNCNNGKCKGIKKGDPPKQDGVVIETSVLKLMLGKAPGTIKGGKWGNKADKKAAEEWRKGHSK